MRTRRKKGQGNNSALLAAKPVQSQFQSRPRVDTIHTPETQSPDATLQTHQEGAKRQGFNFGQIPIFAPIQTKLAVGAPGDKYEQQADLMAEQVVNSTQKPIQRQEGEDEEVQAKLESGVVQRQEGEEEEVQAKLDNQPIQRQEGEDEEVQAKLESGVVQRQEGEEEEVQAKLESGVVQRQEGEEEEVQAKLDNQPIQRQEGEDEEVQAKLESGVVQRQEGEEEEVQAKLDNQPIQRQEAEEEEIQAKPVAGVNKVFQRFAQRDDQQPKPNLAPTGNGKTMPKRLQMKMESAFNSDFSGVRIHEGAQAKSINALAYTRGSDIHFQPGKYQPNSQSGQELLGHELTHVVQQRAGQVAAPQGKGTPINADRKLETEADVLGAKAAKGEPVEVAGGINAGVQRQKEGTNGAVQRQGTAATQKPATQTPVDEVIDKEKGKFESAEESAHKTIGEAITLFKRIKQIKEQVTDRNKGRIGRAYDRSINCFRLMQDWNNRILSDERAKVRNASKTGDISQIQGVADGSVSLVTQIEEAFTDMQKEAEPILSFSAKQNWGKVGEKSKELNMDKLGVARQGRALEKFNQYGEQVANAKQNWGKAGEKSKELNMNKLGVARQGRALGELNQYRAQVAANAKQNWGKASGIELSKGSLKESIKSKDLTMQKIGVARQGRALEKFNQYREQVGKVGETEGADAQHTGQEGMFGNTKDIGLADAIGATKDAVNSDSLGMAGVKGALMNGPAMNLFNSESIEKRAEAEKEFGDTGEGQGLDIANNSLSIGENLAGVGSVLQDWKEGKKGEAIAKGTKATLGIAGGGLGLAKTIGDMKESGESQTAPSTETSSTTTDAGVAPEEISGLEIGESQTAPPTETSSTTTDAGAASDEISGLEIAEGQPTPHSGLEIAESQSVPQTEGQTAPQTETSSKTTDAGAAPEKINGLEIAGNVAKTGADAIGLGLKGYESYKTYQEYKKEHAADYYKGREGALWRSRGRGVKQGVSLGVEAAKVVKGGAEVAGAAGAGGASVAAAVGGGVIPGAQIALGAMDVLQGGAGVYRTGKRRAMLTQQIGKLQGSKKLEEVQQHDTLKNLHDLQKKRQGRSGFKMATGAMGVAGGALAMTGVGLPIAAALGMGALGLNLGRFGVNKFKQWGRNKAEQRGRSKEQILADRQLQRDKLTQKANKTGLLNKFSAWRAKGKLAKMGDSSKDGDYAKQKEGQYKNGKTSLAGRFFSLFDSNKSNKKKNAKTLDTANDLLNWQGNEEGKNAALGSIGLIDEKKNALAKKLLNDKTKTWDDLSKEQQRDLIVAAMKRS